jgi:superfamily I DNA and RNA helicase
MDSTKVGPGIAVKAWIRENLTIRTRFCRCFRQFRKILIKGYASKQRQRPAWESLGVCFNIGGNTMSGNNYRIGAAALALSITAFAFPASAAELNGANTA